MKTNLTALKGMIENYYDNAYADYGVENEGIVVRAGEDNLFVFAYENDNGNHYARCTVLPVNAFTAEEVFNIWMDAENIELPF